ncbi:aldose 1-epimerase [Thermoplasma acidophilum]|uniref:aldose 1-epimerase n=1 Tax=Thermoplasma acidophilum TaxID=2303 RepID=UPI001F5218AE|nr:aldose 1-epimerase [Thermoplasma acidophilum]MCY0852286.1 aldose 1-epimerase [Thermoplasma acidophilum]
MSLQIVSGKSRASISEIGSHMDSLQIDGLDILLHSYDGSPTHFGSAFLFPYANRVKDARYVMDGVEYRLPNNEGKNSIHGLVLDKNFSVISREEESITMETSIAGGEAYPSDLSVRISHSVDETSYRCEVTVINKGVKRSPIAAGFHPYFVYKNKWAIIKPETAWIMEYDGPFPTGKMDRMTFGDISYLNAYDNQFFADSDIIVDVGYSRLKITRNNMPFFVIYNGRYSAGSSVAIEPMMSAVDSFNNGIGLRLLNPGDTMKFGYSIDIV